MRLWSLHPSYLDARGLVALWREGLLAQAVLKGRTRGYQLRFERDHLMAKLRIRDPAAARRLTKIGSPEPHPLFQVVPGGVESWERLRDD